MAKVTITFTDDPENPTGPVLMEMTGDKFDPADPKTMSPAQNVAISVVEGVLRYSAVNRQAILAHGTPAPEAVH
jgi:hypothetical protein